MYSLYMELLDVEYIYASSCRLTTPNGPTINYALHTKTLTGDRVLGYLKSDNVNNQVENFDAHIIATL